MKKIETKEDFEKVLELSKQYPITIFKHSIMCGVSSTVFADMKANKTVFNSKNFFLLVIQETGDLKLHIAETLSVKHESPQAIVVKDAQAVYYANHYEINPEIIQSQLEL